MQPFSLLYIDCNHSFSHTLIVDNVNNVTQADTGNAKPKKTVRTTIIFPRPVWSEVKKAATEKGKTAQEFVVDVVAEQLGVKAA